MPEISVYQYGIARLEEYGQLTCLIGLITERNPDARIQMRFGEKTKSPFPFRNMI